MVVLGEDEPDEWEEGHIPRREELVKAFMIAWDSGEAEWLSFPGTSHTGQLRNNDLICFTARLTLALRHSLKTQQKRHAAEDAAAAAAVDTDAAPAFPAPAFAAPAAAAMVNTK